MQHTSRRGKRVGSRLRSARVAGGEERFDVAVIRRRDRTAAGKLRRDLSTSAFVRDMQRYVPQVRAGDELAERALRDVITSS
jgi:hypothetical protein